MGGVRLADDHAHWRELFEAERERLAVALEGLALELELVGSTAGTGVPATLEVAVGTTTVELPAEALARLAEAGYEEVREARPGERRFRRRAAVQPEVVVHVVAWGGSAWRDYLGVRDALRRRPELAREYAALTRRLLADEGTRDSSEEEAAFVRRAAAHAPPRIFRVSGSPEETEAIAAAAAARLEPGDLVAVAGELGSGKTTFVRGACRALGVERPVTSPTFTVGHRYDGRVPVSHLDLYRFAGLSEADWGALEPYFDDAVCFVEWPEAAGASLPAPRLRVRLGHVDERRRLIVLEGDVDPRV